MFVEIPPHIAVSDFVRRAKGRSSHRICAEPRAGGLSDAELFSCGFWRLQRLLQPIRGRSSSQSLFLKPIGQRTDDQVFGKGSRWFLAALLTPELPKLFDIHDRNASKPCVEIDGGRRFSLPSYCATVKRLLACHGRWSTQSIA
jgi:hypothetical protein